MAVVAALAAEAAVAVVAALAVAVAIHCAQGVTIRAIGEAEEETWAVGLSGSMGQGCQAVPCRPTPRSLFPPRGPLLGLSSLSRWPERGPIRCMMAGMMMAMVMVMVMGD